MVEISRFSRPDVGEIPEGVHFNTPYHVRSLSGVGILFVPTPPIGGLRRLGSVRTTPHEIGFFEIDTLQIGKPKSYEVDVREQCEITARNFDFIISIPPTAIHRSSSYTSDGLMIPGNSGSSVLPFTALPPEMCEYLEEFRLRSNQDTRWWEVVD